MGLVRTLDTLASILDTEGPSSGLAYLNEGVAHRYSAVYRLAGLTLKNVLLHDKSGRLRPEYLAAMNEAARKAHFADGFLDRRTKEMIATHVSALNHCKY